MCDHGVVPRWAQRVPQAKIRQLYESDARGLYDEELINEVGWALYARCRSLIEAEAARQGRAKCHQCEGIIAHSGGKEEVLRCRACGWEITWAAYFRSIQHKQLSGPDLVGIFTEFTSRFPNAARPQSSPSSQQTRTSPRPSSWPSSATSEQLACCAPA